MIDITIGNNSILQAQPRQLAMRHGWLVERGIHSLTILGITERRIQELCSALMDFDFDKRARTLKTIADIGSYIRSSRRSLDSLIFTVVGNIYQYYGPEGIVGYQRQLELFSFGSHYPPGAEYLDLLRTALDALVGPVMSCDVAIMDVLYYGTAASRMIAIEWLSDHGLTAATHGHFSEYLRTSLLSTVQRKPLFLALKYADAVINDHVDDFICFFTDDIILGRTPDELKATARKYLLRLSDQASQETLIDAFVTLTESGDSEDVECASELLNEVMLRDLEEYSDYDLEMICHFMGWPSGEQDELDEYEELIMEELQHRESRN